MLRAIREDEDAARALGKNAFAYKLQSLAIAAALGAIAGCFLALDLATVHPTDFEPLVTFFAYAVLILGGLANYWGGRGRLDRSSGRCSRAPGSSTCPSATTPTRPRCASSIVGLVLILLMAFRPQGMFGKKEEMVLGD